MTKRQMARMISMLVISVLMIASVYGYCAELANTSQPIDYASDVYVDGSDFTSIVNLMVFGTNGIIAFIIAIGNCIAMFIVSLILLLPWCLISIRKNSVIAEMEMKVVKIAFICVPVLSVVFGFVGARFTNLVAVLALTLVATVMFGLLCFLPYFLADKRCRKTEMTYES